MRFHRPAGRRARVVALGLLALGITFALSAVRISLKWRHALDDVATMIVTPATLPQSTSASMERRAGRPDSARPAQPAPANPATPTPPMMSAPINILLLGIDTRRGIAASRTDALAVIHIDPIAQRAGVLSLPRDLWVTIPGHGEGRINAAYPIGERALGPGYGPALAKQAVGDLLGLPIQRFVLIDLHGFKQLIDLLGGITVDVPKAIEDPAYPTDDFGTVAIRFEAGTQRMDGERALQYARTRHADSDFGRNARQQLVLLSIAARIRELGPLRQLTRLDEYTAALRDYVRTDISRDELLQLAGVATWLQPDAVDRITIGPGMLTMLEQPATFVIKPEALRGAVDKLLGQPIAAR